MNPITQKEWKEVLKLVDECGKRCIELNKELYLPQILVRVMVSIIITKYPPVKEPEKLKILALLMTKHIDHFMVTTMVKSIILENPQLAEDGNKLINAVLEKEK